MQVERAALQVPALNWVGCTVLGEAPYEVVFGVDEVLLGAETRLGRQNAEHVWLLARSLGKFCAIGCGMLSRSGILT